MAFNLFQRFFKQEKEVLSFNDITTWLEKKEQEDKDFIPIIKERIETFIEDLNKQLTILEQVDIEKKKADHRVKAITKGNLNKYITHVKTLKTNLNVESLKELNLILTNFFQKSETNYQKATLLIGKEISDTRTTIGKFGQFVTKNISNESEIRNEIKEKIEIIENDDENEIKANIKKLKEKIKEKNEEESRIKEEREKSDEQAREQKANYEAKIKENQKKIHEIKMLIDFKELSNTFHASKEMKTVRKYKENFETALKDNKKTLLKLLEEAKMPTEEITAIIETMKEPKPPKIKVSPQIQGHNLNKEKEREEKRLEKIKKEKEELRASLKDDFERMGVILEI